MSCNQPCSWRSILPCVFISTLISLYQLAAQHGLSLFNKVRSFGVGVKLYRMVDIQQLCIQNTPGQSQHYLQHSCHLNTTFLPNVSLDQTWSKRGRYISVINGPCLNFIATFIRLSHQIDLQGPSSYLCGHSEHLELYFPLGSLSALVPGSVYALCCTSLWIRASAKCL